MNKKQVRQPHHDTPFDVVVIGSSLGGIAALQQLVSSLPPNFRVPVVIVQHRSSQVPFMLAHILRRSTSLSIVDAQNGDSLQAGVIYLAVPGQHLSFDATGRFILTNTERVNFVRPSIDVLFKSAAAIFENRVLAVILTGRGKDGADGALAIKRAGGVIMVQDEPTSRAFDMPRAAIQTQHIDFVLPLNTIAPALVTLTMVTGATSVFHVPVFPSSY
jgi:two-component system, chemotaxis family, protein-glutamate methylesterase/glutaminase